MCNRVICSHCSCFIPEEHDVYCQECYSAAKLRQVAEELGLADLLKAHAETLANVGAKLEPDRFIEDYVESSGKITPEVP